MNTENFQCGFVALIGRPNVGKSTLINHILEEKLSITSHKPQTTRHRILGIHTTPNSQVIYLDTPGVHKFDKKAINRVMNKTALNSLMGMNVILFLVDATKWTDEDQYVLDCLKNMDTPIVLVVNKVDLISDKQTLLPLIDELSSKHNFAAVFPISARKGSNVPELQASLLEYLPEGPALYDEDQLTDRGMRFMISELIREQLYRFCQQELPYSTAVAIEEMVEEKDLYRMAALIVVERDSQKGIVIGKGGTNLKRIGTAARLEIENLLEKKVFLQLWVKVKADWADDEQMLQNLGYQDPYEEK